LKLNEELGVVEDDQIIILLGICYARKSGEENCRHVVVISDDNNGQQFEYKYGCLTASAQN